MLGAGLRVRPPRQDHFILRRPAKNNPISPEPKSNMVEGTGTGTVVYFPVMTLLSRYIMSGPSVVSVNFKAKVKEVTGIGIKKLEKSKI